MDDITEEELLADDANDLGLYIIKMNWTHHYNMYVIHIHINPNKTVD